MNKIIIKEDMHIHSTYSDGVNTLEENIGQAETLGLQKICCVDHVRRDTVWLGDFAAHIERLKNETTLEILSGAETKLLNAQGELDLPDDWHKVDFLYVADHQFPLADGVRHPREIREMLKTGVLTVETAIENLCRATIAAMRLYPKIVIAHLFSILPKIGLSETDVPERLLEELADTAKRFDVRIEIDERWKCPTYRTVSYFKSQNVPIWFSTDSHRRETIGKYSYNLEIYEKLR